MANSIIDDMLKNQVPPKKKKSGARIILFMIIFLIILLAVAIAVVLYLKDKNKLTDKDAFIQYLGKTDISSIVNFEKINTLNTRLQSEAAESTTDISGSVSSGLVETDIDLSELKLEVVSKNDSEKNKNTSDISILYKDNEMINFNILSNEDEIGIISDEIVVKYLGAKYSNLGDIISKASNGEYDIDFDLKQLKNTQLVLPQFSNDILLKYVDIIKQKVPDTAFTSKPITLDRTAGKLDVTEYSMTLTESQAVELIDLMLQTLENDDALLDMLLASLGENSSQVKELIKSQIEVYINSLYQNTPDDSKIYTLKVYGANDITYKMSIDFYGEFSIDIDYNYSESANSMTITFLETEGQNGYSIDIIKKISDVTETLDFTVNMINDSEIVGKVNFVSDLVNSGNSYTLKNKIDINFMIFVINIQTNSQINFKQVSIPNLTNDNCLYLDQLDQDTFDDVIEAVKTRAEEVLDEKLIGQGLKTVEDAEEIPAEPPATINTESVKEEAKSKLINAISEAMTTAQNEGKTYSLIDLMTLEIPDSTFSVSIDNDIATLNIDGFEFKLNSEFQLYE